MHIDQSILDTEYQRLQQLTDEVLQNPELFRNDAQRALKLYNPRERIITNQLVTYLSVTSFFDKWQSQLQSPRQALRANETNKSFLNALDKYLLLDQKHVTNISHSLITARDQALVEQFLDSLNIPESRKGRSVHQTLLYLLAWSDHHLLTYKEHYVAATLYSAVSTQQGITVIDPNVSFFQRMKARRHIRRERRAILKQEKKQLHVIQKELELLIRKPLVSDILNSGLELVQFLSARAAYEKKLSGLPEAESRQISVRSTVMIKETTSLRKAFHSAQSDITATTLPAYDLQFDTLVRGIFSISTVQKNILMADMKRYRELLAAKDEIAATQSARIAIRNKS